MTTAHIDDAFATLADLRDTIKNRGGKPTPAERAEIGAMIALIEEPGTIKALWQSELQKAGEDSKSRPIAWHSSMTGNA